MLVITGGYVLLPTCVKSHGFPPVCGHRTVQVQLEEVAALPGLCLPGTSTKEHQGAGEMIYSYLVGGLNPSEKYESQLG